MVQIAFDNSFARLPERFYARQHPTHASTPRLIALNRPLAEELGLDGEALAASQGMAVLAGNFVPDGAEPLAMAYAGHQFGHFVPQLGDGRAVLLGEIVDREGVRRDLQLKGAGRTPFSRQGDGRAALGPVLREYLVSEAFAALGVPTTRALAVVATGDEIWRDMPLPGAVLARVAASHLRVGSFQYFAARGDTEAIRLLADYAITRHVPEAAAAPNRYRAFLDEVIARQAKLIAQWLSLGFIHGVMNTDNMSIAGETIDFGPCAFLDIYDPAKVFSAIDQGGRYAFANQPRIGLWNLTRLAECLLPLLGPDEASQLDQANTALDAYAGLFEAAYTERLRAKLGLLTAQEGDLALARDLLRRMAEGGADFTNTFRALCEAADDSSADGTVRKEFSSAHLFDEWAIVWRSRLAAERPLDVPRAAAMRRVNPRYIPRNHRIEQVIAAAYTDDFAPFSKLVAILSSPYEEQPQHADYAAAPAPDEVVTRTFCGT